MRVLLLLRGSAGCGKSTWIEQNGLKPYTLSADDIRLMCASPCMMPNGDEQIDASNDTVVWRMLFNLLEQRMQNGEFTVIDATNSKTSEMKRYKELCDSYRYRIYCIDFTDIPIEVVKERNKQRDPIKWVPDEAIDKFYSRFATQKIPSGITVIKPNELEKIWLRKIDLSKYSKIHHIGDIHGCYTALKQYFDSDGGIKDDEFYIFCGDYCDRGIENADTVNFLLSIYGRLNVCMLEGNHDRNLWIWANDGVSPSKEFELVTKSELDKAKVDKKEVRKMYRHFGQCAYYDYHGNTYFVCHGGLSTIPECLSKVSTKQLIRGVGGYGDVESVVETFEKTTADNVYQVFGHRNPKSLPTRVNDRVFNLEGKVEFGGCLRILRLEPDGTQTVVEISNDVFAKEKPPKSGSHAESETSVGDTIMELRRNRYIQEKKFGDISSFNFSRTAFYDKIWDEQTTKARGLYINIPKQKVVARAYDKFFNINERPETKFDMLQHKLVFPVTAYVKENGFLGIVSYDEENDSLFITTKSDPTGDFAGWLKDMLQSKVSESALEDMKLFAKDNNVSFVFECVDMKNDPHIIEYPENRLYLLDIVYNDLQYHKYSFEEMCEVADRFGLLHKEKAFVIDSWQDFFDWYYKVLEDDYLYNGRVIEGFVIEDSKGYMVKLKLSYYHFWKYMRSIAHEAIRKGYIDGRKTSSLTTPLANQFYAWVKTLHDDENRDSLPKDICSLRNLFYKTDIGKQFISE